jgi:O-antigen ligase
MAFGFAQLQQIPLVKAFTLAAYNRKLTLEEWLLFRRITATFDGQSNQAGFFGYLYAGLIAGLLLCMPRQHLKRWGYVYAALLAASLYFNLGTGSRAALGGLIAAAGAVIFLGGRRDLIFSATSAITVVIGLGVTVSDVIRNRLGELVDVLTGANIELVAGNRFTRWQNAFEAMFWPSPIFGSGPFRFTADSSYVAELCIRGVIGLLIYCAFIIIVGRAAYITWKHGTHPLGRALGVCVLVSTIGIALQGFTIAVLSGTRPAELWFLLVATMWLFYPAQKRRLLGRERAEPVKALPQPASPAAR